ncbi:uncharacterized protein B0H64DRAFT_130179 [Chaetomium fimeti]|uniref:Uncharacterized protein n=1 Tax=Chaetomium fimeti TaxID=1854472 RepID=A0AAE0LTZ2_9PEZI|nr:hypothetical protein B0H64DRAFT_130179 [Chaetomium fimeti]
MCSSKPILDVTVALTISLSSAKVQQLWTSRRMKGLFAPQTSGKPGDSPLGRTSTLSLPLSLSLRSVPGSLPMSRSLWGMSHPGSAALPKPAGICLLFLFVLSFAIAIGESTKKEKKGKRRMGI